jgi:hypothetical protein
MDTQSDIVKCHSDILIGSTFLIASHIGNISVTLHVYHLINDSDQAKPIYAVHYLLIDIGYRVSIVNGHSLYGANLIPSRRTNDYLHMLQWIIPREMRCHQHQNIMTS